MAGTQTPAQAREAGLRFVHQQNSTFPDMTVAENLAIGRGFERGFPGRIKWSRVRAHAAGVLDRFGIEASPNTYVRDLGPATQMMLAIARALQDQAEAHDGVLVLDEPTASLPKAEVDFLLAALRRYATAGQTVVYVTHRLEEVVAVAERATVLRDGKVVSTVERAELNHERLVSLMVGRSIEVDIAPASTLANGNPPETGVVLDADGLGRFKDIDVRLRAGEIVGVAGLLGSGRSALLRALFGAEGVAEVLVDGAKKILRNPDDAKRAGIVYVPEDRGDAVFADLTINENMAIATLGSYSRHGRISRRAERSGSREAMDRFLVRGASLNDPVSSLSGGNQQKVILARWLQRDPRVLLLDEPTQGVDVGARAEIHALIRQAVDGGATAMVVSSDVDELTSISDRVIVMRHGRLVGELVGDAVTESRLDSMVYSREKVA